MTNVFLSVLKRFQFFVLLLFMACAPKDGWLTHVDHTKKFKIDYPENWTKQSAAVYTLFLSPKETEHDAFQENVNVGVQDLASQPLTLDEYTDLTKNQIIENSGSIISLKKASVSKHNGMEIIFRVNYGGNDLKFKQYWFIYKEKAYLLTYTALFTQFDKYERTADEAFKSFSLIN